MVRLPVVESVARCEPDLRNDNDLAVLLDDIAGRRIVLLGEASHGTSEFYDWRRRTSSDAGKQFSFVAVEAGGLRNEDIAAKTRGHCGIGVGYENYPTGLWLALIQPPELRS